MTAEAPKKVFKIGECNIWGAGGSKVAQLLLKGVTPELIIDLGNAATWYKNYLKQDGVVPLPPKFFDLVQQLEKKYAPPPVLAVSWTDGAAAPLQREAWDGLVECIAGTTGDIVINCVGGHGRTGTALAIIGVLGGVLPADTCPVKAVRAMYCQEAVETEDQLDYIERITGRTVTSVAGKSWGTTVTTVSGAHGGASWGVEKKELKPKLYYVTESPEGRAILA